MKLAKYLAQYLVVEENRMEEEGLPSPENYVELQNWFEKTIQQGIEAFTMIENVTVEIIDGKDDVKECY